MTERQIKSWLVLGLILIIGAIVRLLFLPFVGNGDDVSTFIAWADALDRYGILNIYRAPFPESVTLPNYPPVGLYGLWFLTKLFGPWGAATIRIPAIGIDLLAGVLVWVWHRRALLRVCGALTAAVVLNPAVFLISAYWGQIDVVYALGMAGALLLAASNRFALAASVAAIAVLTKIQAVVAAPVLVAWCFIVRTPWWRPLAAGAATLILIAVPFLITGRGADLVHPIFGITRAYPFLTVNAMNIWWPIAGGELRPDTIAILGVPAVFVGFFLFAMSVALGLLFLHRHHTVPDVFLVATWVSLTFFFFNTDMHERYLFPVFLLVPFAIPAYPRIGWALLGVLSYSFVANILYVIPIESPLVLRAPAVLRFVLIETPWLANLLAVGMMGLLFARRFWYAEVAHHSPRLQ